MSGVPKNHRSGRGRGAGPLNQTCDVAPDGQRFYAVQARTPVTYPAVTHINLVQNWFEELKAKVPARR